MAEPICIPQTPVHTARLSLRAFSQVDEAAVCRLLRSTLVNRTYMLPDFADDAAAVPLFRRLMAFSLDPARFVRAIALDGTCIGWLNETGREDGMIELGYVIAPDRWGCGYATEALTAAIDVLFSAGFACVRAGHFAENTASRRVMEKAGLKPIDLTEQIDYRGQTHLCRYLEARR